MSKATAAAGLSATGAIAAAGGIYLSNMNSFDSILPKNVKEFEDKGHEEGCVQSLFVGLEKLNGTNATDAGNIEGTFLGSSETDKKKSEGCLVINWDKEKYGEGNSQKWKGDFRLLWSVKNRNSTHDKGFIVFATATPTSGNKLKWTGSVYALEKKVDEDKWSVKNVVKISDNKEVEFKDKFPKPKLTTKAFWGFVNEENDISGKICGDNDCSDTSKKRDEPFQSYWSWKGGEGEVGKQKLGEWTDKLEEWWKDTFGDDKWKMKEVVKDISGQWTQQV